MGDLSTGYSLKLKSSWRPIERNSKSLERRLTEFITVISGPTPERDSGCEQCRYVSRRREIFGGE